MKRPYFTSPLKEAKVAALTKRAKMMHNKEKLFWATEAEPGKEKSLILVFGFMFFLFKIKPDFRFPRVFFTTTCRYRVINRSHSCLKHSVCSAGSSFLADKWQSLEQMFFPRCFSSSDFHVSIRAIVQLEIGCYPPCSPTVLVEGKRERVTVKLELFFCLVFFFHFEFKQGLSRLLSWSCCTRVHQHFAWLKTDLLQSGGQLWTSAAPPAPRGVFADLHGFGGGNLSCSPSCRCSRYLLRFRRRLTM